MNKPWVSFCMSTYKRPLILRNQLELLGKQTFTNFEVIISDNDPDESAREIVETFHDERFRYFHNEDNLGMIKSFNKSIERATAPYIVMITDDDPVEPFFLEYFYQLSVKFPDLSIYGGFERKNKRPSEIEIIAPDKFINEILDPRLTTNLLWSSVIIRKIDAINSGFIPDYGSPHLADHALLARSGSIKGALVVNKMFSTLTSHDLNFSKFNFHFYVNGCQGFYQTMVGSASEKIIKKHLKKWFISNIFNAKKYYTTTKRETEMIKKISICANEILSFPFMKDIRWKYRIKKAIFYIKSKTGLLK